MERNEVGGILVRDRGNDDDDDVLCTVTRADVNKLIQGIYTPLHCAVLMQSVEHVKALLEMGADPNNNNNNHVNPCLEYAVMMEGSVAVQIHVYYWNMGRTGAMQRLETQLYTEMSNKCGYSLTMAIAQTLGLLTLGYQSVSMT